MGEIFIQSGDVQIGPFSESHVRQSITGGTLSPLAMSWRKGNEEWVPLYILLKLKPPAGKVAPPKAKERHGCLTAFLAFLILMSSIGAADACINIYRLHHQVYGDSNVITPAWYSVIIILSSVANLLCVIALITWKKWGFWGYIISNLILAIISFFVHTNNLPGFMGGLVLMGVNMLGGVIMVGLLYMALQMGNKEKGWKKLS